MRNIPIIRGILLILNLLAAVALILATLAGKIPPSKHAVFSALALIYPILIFVNISFVILWIALNKKFWLLSILIILVDLNNLRNNFQLNFNNNKVLDDGLVKIISYNIQLFSTDEKGKDSAFVKDQIVKFLKKEDANIICLQEYHSMDRNVYKPLIQLKYSLLKNSYYYESYFTPRFDQLSGLVIFSDYIAINKGKLKFPGSRTFGIFTDLLIREDTVRVFNIHLASIRLQASDIDFVMKPDLKDQKRFKNRASQIYSKLSEAFKLREAQINTVVSMIKSSPYPIILSGDFNDTPSSYAYSRLCEHLTDNFTKKGKLLGSTYAGDIPYLRIDYIFSSKDFKVNYFERYKKKYSDHYPLISGITFK
jgi:endonuclease/exonuclease/phosphatase family metal-dependent hydrolase